MKPHIVLLAVAGISSVALASDVPDSQDTPLPANHAELVDDAGNMTEKSSDSFPLNHTELVDDNLEPDNDLPENHTEMVDNNIGPDDNLPPNHTELVDDNLGPDNNFPPNHTEMVEDTEERDHPINYTEMVMRMASCTAFTECSDNCISLFPGASRGATINRISCISACKASCK
ncbi:hypothetical protein VTO42DRAFT_1359 [Malbranchea cinnamomea]